MRSFTKHPRAIQAAIEPMDISDAMRQQSLSGLDKAVQRVNSRIEDALRNGRDHICFPLSRDNRYYDEVRRMFEKKGYVIKPTGYLGGVRQDTEDMYW